MIVINGFLLRYIYSFKLKNNSTSFFFENLHLDDPFYTKAISNK